MMMCEVETPSRHDRVFNRGDGLVLAPTSFPRDDVADAPLDEQVAGIALREFVREDP